MMRIGGLLVCAIAAACATRAPEPPLEADFRPPRLLNAEEVATALRGYASEREQRVVLWLYVDTAGYPARVQIRTGTGRASLDSAAVRVAQRMEFEPARRGDARVAAWVEQALVFVAAPAGPRDVTARTAPRLLNDVSVVGEIRSTYRALSGWARAWIRIAPSGRLDDARVLAASDPRLERAAREIVLGFRFEPARLVRTGGLAGEATEASAIYRIDFGPSGTVRVEIADLDQAGASALRATAPYDAPPRARDPARVRAALGDAIRRVGGPASARALLWLFIDERGEVALTHLRRSSGDERVDEALRAAIERLEFVPARRGDRPVGAWLELPVGAPRN